MQYTRTNQCVLFHVSGMWFEHCSLACMSSLKYPTRLSWADLHTHVPTPIMTGNFSKIKTIQGFGSPERGRLMSFSSTLINFPIIINPSHYPSLSLLFKHAHLSLLSYHPLVNLSISFDLPAILTLCMPPPILSPHFFSYSFSINIFFTNSNTSNLASKVCCLGVVWFNIGKQAG